MCHRGSDVIRDGANLAGVTTNGLSGGSSSLIFTKDYFKKLPKIEGNFTNFEVWSSKTELPKIEITNIEGNKYRGTVLMDIW